MAIQLVIANLRQVLDKGKPIVRSGRKVMGLDERSPGYRMNPLCKSHCGQEQTSSPRRTLISRPAVEVSPMMFSHLFRSTQGGAPTRTGSCKTNRSGAAAVEFALIAPLLFMLFLGFVDVGRAIMVKNLLTSAARDGARSATLDGATVTDIQEQVSTFLIGASVGGVTVTVTPDPLTTAEIGDPVSVNASVPFSAVSWLPSSFYFGGVSLESTVVMRRETN